MKNAHSHKNNISSIILAAGQSKRMGKQKLLLDWNGMTVIQSVVAALQKGGCDQIVIVTGASHNQLSEIFKEMPGIMLAYNKAFDQTEMLQSLQIGVQSLPCKTDAFFIALGDQPQISYQTVVELQSHFLPGKPQIIIPSFEMRRGHPWLVSMDYAQDILALPPEKTLRDFLNAHKNKISYINMDNENILKDLDTPQDYERDRPK